MKRMPSVFIGSASESLDIAEALEFELKDVAGTVVWNRVLRPGHYTLEELFREASEVDFAVFILGQEDKTESKGHIVPSPRDNVVYEAGLFGGRMEVSRVFLLVDARGSKIPSDWQGLGYVTYDPTMGSSNEAIRPASIVIRKQIKDWCSAIEQQILGQWWQYVMNLEQGSVITLISITPAIDTSRWKVTGKAWTSAGKSIAECWSRATTFDARDRKLFYYWEGRHPYDKTMPHFIGVGEIEFDQPTSGSVSTAKGWFSESPLAQLDQTVRKAVRYIRVNEEDIRVVQSGDQKALERLISTRISEWKDMLRQGRS
jgi:hypothetical protein